MVVKKTTKIEIIIHGPTVSDNQIMSMVRNQLPGAQVLLIKQKTWQRSAPRSIAEALDYIHEQGEHSPDEIPVLVKDWDIPSQSLKILLSRTPWVTGYSREHTTEEFLQINEEDLAGVNGIGVGIMTIVAAYLNSFHLSMKI